MTRIEFSLSDLNKLVFVEEFKYDGTLRDRYHIVQVQWINTIVVHCKMDIRDPWHRPIVLRKSKIDLEII